MTKIKAVKMVLIDKKSKRIILGKKISKYSKEY